MNKGLAIVGLCIAPTIHAAGISPYLPLNTAPVIERHIEHLMAVTAGAPLTKPYKAADVNRRLTQIKQSHPSLHSQLAHYLRRYKKRTAVTYASAGLATSDAETTTQLANQYSQTSTDRAAFKLQSFHFFSPYIYLSQGAVQLVNDDSKFRTEQVNTHLGIGNEYFQVDAGYRPHWFSPMQSNNGLITTHGESSPSVTLSNSTAISPWNIRYELFQRKLSQTDGIANQTNPLNSPRVSGLHVSISPVQRLTIGYSKIAQYGGDAYDYSFADHVTSLYQADQLTTPDSSLGSGYQMTAFSAKWNNHWGINASLYGEYYRNQTTGESVVTQINDASGSGFGIHVPDIGIFNTSVTIERTELSGYWYQSPLLQNGYTDKQLNLGHSAWRQDAEQTQQTMVNFAMPLFGHHYLDVKLEQTRYQWLADSASRDLKDTRSEVNIGYSIASEKGLWTLRLIAGEEQSKYQRLSLQYEW